MSALATTDISALPQPGGGGDQPATISLQTRDTSARNQVIPNPAGQLASARKEEDMARSNTGKPHQPHPGPQEQADLARAVSKAAQGGVMSLPPAHVPTTQDHLSADPNTQTQKIPQPNPMAAKGDYIPAVEQVQHQNLVKQGTPERTGNLVNEEVALAAVLAGVLFMISRLPPVEAKVALLIPGFLGKDRSPTTRGSIIGSIGFGATFYAAARAIVWFAIER